MRHARARGDGRQLVCSGDAELRSRLQLVAGRPGYPQMLLRLGFGQEIPATPRRPISEVLAG